MWNDFVAEVKEKPWILILIAIAIALIAWSATDPTATLSITSEPSETSKPLDQLSQGELEEAELNLQRRNAKRFAKQLPRAAPGLFVSLCHLLSTHGYTQEAERLFIQRIEQEKITTHYNPALPAEMYLQTRIQCNL